jgi:hypothetical protein
VVYRRTISIDSPRTASMAITIICPDCQTSINVRSDLAGRTLKCPGCERELTEADVAPPLTAAPPARPVARRERERDEEPRRRRPVDEDRPVRRRRDRDDDDYDDEDDDYDRRDRRRPRDRKKKKAAGVSPLALGIAAGVFILIVATVAVVYILTKGSDGEGIAGTTTHQMKWEYQTLPGTTLAVEMPEYARTEKAGRANPFGEAGVGLTHIIHTGNGTMSLTASQLSGAILPVPGGGDILDFIAEGAKGNPNMRITDRSPVQGRRSLTIVMGDPELTRVQRYIQDGSRTYLLSCDGEGINESTPEVRRFLDSPRFR